MKKDTVLILILTSLIIVLGISNIYQYKKSLELKIGCGQRISNIVTYALVGVPRLVLDDLSNSTTINEVDLAKTIERVSVAKTFVFTGVEGFSQVRDFLENTEKDLKKLYKLIKQNKREQEIDFLINKIKENQKKSLKAYEEIRNFFQEYMSQRNKEKKGAEWHLLWYKNSVGDSEEFIKIIDKRLKLEK
ncbi:hypothetical protein [Caloranaerobacter azorensis]|uniref:Uncharacterized protein n=1 Tax=Caloranaerobacter azorensis TaxID=116090 RepID=A0A6P1YFI0_9FIRM|nr:hypothetical protein [Caloranaerobacter azorensis]QIB26925.1 hypothetical protein G3A45_06230 [Caloranaerobacter azorensis]